MLPGEHKGSSEMNCLFFFIGSVCLHLCLTRHCGELQCNDVAIFHPLPKNSQFFCDDLMIAIYL